MGYVGGIKGLVSYLSSQVSPELIQIHSEWVLSIHLFCLLIRNEAL